MNQGISVDGLTAEASAFLEANAPLRTEAGFEWGHGSDRVGIVPESRPEQDRLELDAAREWSRQVHDAGFGWLAGPPAYGGRGLSRAHAGRWRELQGRHVTPPPAVFGVGLGMVAPTILAPASEEVKQRWPRWP